MIDGSLVARIDDVASSTGYDLEVSRTCEDPLWDAFVAKTPGGRHFQSSLWAQVKSELGWEVARVVATGNGAIVAGTQMLIRTIPLFGSIGYASRAPLFAVDDPALRDLVISKLCQVAEAWRIQYLVVQPPCNGWHTAEHLLRWGFVASPVIQVAPLSTVLIDLTQDLDSILQGMTPRTRQYIRAGQRNGIRVIEGSKDDIATFRRLLATTASRKKWWVHHEKYHYHMWHVLSPNNHVRLTLAEYRGEVVSALLIHPFGEGVYGSTIVSTGCDNNIGASELLLLDALKWAKAKGHMYFDLGRVKPDIARKIVTCASSPREFVRGYAFFKLRLGGRPVFCPGAYVYVRNPVLRLVHNAAVPAISDSRVFRETLKKIRGFGRS